MDDEILRKLESIERRITQLEGRKNIIEEERTEVAPLGELHSVEEAQVNDGTVTTRKIPFCECGNRLEEFFLCHICKKILCDNCSSSFRKQRYCSTDLLKRLPITVQGFKALLCIANEISKDRNICKITSIPRDELKDSIGFLKRCGYIDVSFMNKKSITDFGLECVSAWGQFYGGSDEMRQVDVALRRHLNGF